eukprot:3324463-Karenia_brevis.AAC.1
MLSRVARWQQLELDQVAVIMAAVFDILEIHKHGFPYAAIRDTIYRCSAYSSHHCSMLSALHL